MRTERSWISQPFSIVCWMLLQHRIITFDELRMDFRNGEIVLQVSAAFVECENVFVRAVLMPWVPASSRCIMLDFLFVWCFVFSLSRLTNQNPAHKRSRDAEIMKLFFFEEILTYLRKTLRRVRPGREYLHSFFAVTHGSSVCLSLFFFKTSLVDYKLEGNLKH